MAIKLRSSSEKQILKDEGRNCGRNLKGRIMGLFLALFLAAAVAGGVMAFYPWLSKEMQAGKTIVPAEEWESGPEEYAGSAESLYGEETYVYPGYDYYVESRDSSSYEGYVIYMEDEVWVLPGYIRVEDALEAITLGAAVLVVLLAFFLAAVRYFQMTDILIFKMPFELMVLTGFLIFGISMGSGMGPQMACAALSGESMALMSGGYYQMSPESAETVLAAVNYASWFFLALTLFWMAETAASFFTLGPARWFRERTLTGAFLRFLKRFAVNSYRQVEKIDLRERSTKTLIRIVGINFVLLTVFCSLWFFGIFGLIVYSAVLYLILRRLYDRMQEKYKILLRATNELAEGNLDVEITEDLGVFEPFRDEIQKIRTGFKKAVEEEVKSQRMKTELITNVSHDLKTPLTAIITYVNLLKQPQLTKEEREEYIQILDQKSMRLKALIEDLFEVSKANSGSIALNLVEVDVVSLMKQVRLELDDRMRTSGIDFRFQLPDRKIKLLLDSEKTYRVFENLLINIVKYGMPGTRAYIEITEREEEGQEKTGEVRVAMKNISAAELSDDGRDLTDRFVRGDQSRNTEGSGLGLAIARSFVELQGGRFELETEADLFKVTLMWKKDGEREETAFS